MAQRWDRCLIAPGTCHSGMFELDSGGWRRFSIGAEVDVGAGPYLVPDWPIEFHCHGLGDIDFSAFDTYDLSDVNDALAAEGVRAILTVYLPRKQLEPFRALLADYERRRAELPCILGFAVEGPLFSSFGGTPAIGVWAPTRAEWQAITGLSAGGLRYVVLSPDAHLDSATLAAGMGPGHPDLTWITEHLIDHGVRPAPGHFMKGDPERSAAALRSMLDVAVRLGTPLVSDHIFNDMPCRLPYAWRTAEARRRREDDLASADLSAWTLDDLDARLGVVPATLLRAARDGALKLCVNFDGEHVDSAISRRVVELVGAENVIAMTDRASTGSLGGQPLHRRNDNRLLYQEEGVVAAGSHTIDELFPKMRASGLNPLEAWQVALFTPAATLNLPTTVPPSRFSSVDEGGRREGVVL